MIPARFAPLLFALILSGIMSSLVTCVATLRNVGMVPDFAAVWMATWISAWAVAFPTAAIVAPLARRVVTRMVRAD